MTWSFYSCQGEVSCLCCIIYVSFSNHRPCLRRYKLSRLNVLSESNQPAEKRPEKDSCWFPAAERKSFSGLRYLRLGFRNIRHHIHQSFPGLYSLGRQIPPRRVTPEFKPFWWRIERLQAFIGWVVSGEAGTRDGGESFRSLSRLSRNQVRQAFDQVRRELWFQGCFNIVRHCKLVPMVLFEERVWRKPSHRLVMWYLNAMVSADIVSGSPFLEAISSISPSCIQTTYFAPGKSGVWGSRGWSTRRLFSLFFRGSTLGMRLSRTSYNAKRQFRFSV